MKQQAQGISWLMSTGNNTSTRANKAKACVCLDFASHLSTLHVLSLALFPPFSLQLLSYSTASMRMTGF